MMTVVRNDGVMNMKLPSFRLAAIDSLSHSLLVINGASGEILSELLFPSGFTPIELAVSRDGKKVFLPGYDENGTGCLLMASISRNYLYHLPVSLPQPTQFTLSFDDCHVYFTDAENYLHQLNSTTLGLKTWGCPADAACVGLAADEAGVYSVWEHGGKGSLAIFNHHGQVLHEQLLPGIPTNITFDRRGHILIPVTSTDPTGEGIICFDFHSEPANRQLHSGFSQGRYIMYTREMSNGPAYPCNVTLSSERNMVYIVNEESEAIAMINLSPPTLLGQIFIGRPISYLHLLPGGTWGIASGHMTPCLLLIDLLAGNVAFISDSARLLMGYIAVLP
jgi:hypothetical protein